jgi:hypothetical protein
MKNHVRHHKYFRSFFVLSVVAGAIGAKLAVVESNFGNDTFTGLLKSVLKKLDRGCRIKETRSARQKELRIIDTLKSVLPSRRLIVDPNVIRDDYASLDR